MTDQLFGCSDEPGPRRWRSTRTSTCDADRDARAFAADPEHNVVLEASAGTGKTQRPRRRATSTC